MENLGANLNHSLTHSFTNSFTNSLTHSVTNLAPKKKTVAIIGGGYAGMAAAVKLAELDQTSTVFEAAKILGGRARRVDYLGMTLDNGQHILSGAYTELLRMMALVGVSGTAFERIPLKLTFGIPAEFSLCAPKLAAPWHMVAALLTAKGLDWSERIAAIRLMRALTASHFIVDHKLCVADLMTIYRQPPKLVQFLWQPLTISALNTPLATASAQVFANVLRDALATNRAASDLILPTIDLTRLFPETAATWLDTQGSRVQTGCRITAIEKNDHGFEVVYGDHREQFSHVIVAVAPHQLDTLLSRDPAIRRIFSDSVAHFQYEPITTIYLAFSPSQKLLPATMLGRSSGLVQWFFNRETLSGETGLVAGVISASGSYEALSLDELATTALGELREWLPHLASPLWHKVIQEKRATFACTADLKRPATETDIPGLVLAGDYVDCDYPATLEAAVRNGCSAAEIIYATAKNL